MKFIKQLIFYFLYIFYQYKQNHNSLQLVPKLVPFLHYFQLHNLLFNFLIIQKYQNQIYDYIKLCQNQYLDNILILDFFINQILFSFLLHIIQREYYLKYNNRVNIFLLFIYFLKVIFLSKIFLLKIIKLDVLKLTSIIVIQVLQDLIMLFP